MVESVRFNGKDCLNATGGKNVKRAESEQRVLWQQSRAECTGETEETGRHHLRCRWEMVINQFVKSTKIIFQMLKSLLPPLHYMCKEN